MEDLKTGESAYVPTVNEWTNCTLRLKSLEDAVSLLKQIVFGVVALALITMFGAIFLLVVPQNGG